MAELELHGTLFGPGLPSHGQAERVQLLAHALRTSDGRLVSYDALTCRAGGWRGDALLIEWRDDAGPSALAVADRKTVTALAELGPERLREQLSGFHESRAHRRRRGLGALGAVVLLVLLLVAGVLFALSRTDRLVALVPASWEQRAGELVAAAWLGDAGGAETGRAADVVREIGERLAAHVDSPYTFEFHLVASPEVNAFALPGGSVVVTTGLLATAASADELAGVLAHEIQHVVERHSLRAMVRQLGWGATLGVLLGGHGLFGEALQRAAAQLGSLSFSREQERAADLGGVRLLERAGIPASGMAAFFARLAANHDEPPAWLASHPPSAERAEAVRAAIRDERGDERGVQRGDGAGASPFAHDWAAIQSEALEAARK